MIDDNLYRGTIIQKEQKKHKSKRRRKHRHGFYSADELIKLWYDNKSQVS